MKHILILLISCFALSAQAGEGSWSQRFLLNDVTMNLDYTMFSPEWISEESHDYVNRLGLIHLDYTRKDHSDLEGWNDWHIWITIGYKVNGTSSYIQDTLEINSQEDLYKYSDYVKFNVGTNGYVAHVSKVEGEYFDGTGWQYVNSPQYDSNFPIDIDFRLELREEKWYDLGDSETTPEFSNIWFDELTYRANWQYFEGAEQYDFEWVWIDSLSQEYADLTNTQTGLSASNPYSYELPFSLKEPSRVRLNNTHYKLDQTYSSGILYFRVRGISKYTNINTGAYDQVKEGEWMYFEESTNFDYTTGTFNMGYLTDHEVLNGVDAFEKKKNWLYGVAYAEEGKSVSSVTFYDGSNRGRQSLTYNTSDDITLIGESKFDFEGRQTVSVVPAPVKGRSLGYRTLFNIKQNGAEFSESDFDHANYNTNPPEPLASLDIQDNTRELGSAQYFSSDNKFDDDLFRAAIPDANGYVYSQTVYRNDGTGRIEEVGGIGSTFQVGGDHSVKTYYGSTNAVELQRLFGDNVSSIPNGYRKEMVRDANGQYSVTYYDKRGNVIATALSGNSPENLLELEDQETINVTTSLNDNNMAVDPYTMISEHTHLTSLENTTIKLNYDINSIVNQLTTTPVDVNGHTVLLGDFCSTCRYDLTIEVIDQNGAQVDEVNGNYGINTIVPYQMSIDPAGNCYDATTGAVLSGATGIGYSTPELSYLLVDVGEYRIIKTLRVDQASMQAAFDEQLSLSGADDPSSFVAEYISNIDISGCFTNCDDYCYWYVSHVWQNEYPTIPWDSADENDLTNLTLDQLQAIEDCKSGMCNIDEMYENFDSETAGTNPTISPMEQGCQGYRMQMIAQISPGGVYYDTQVSGFWAKVLDEEFGGVETNTTNIPGFNNNPVDFNYLQDPTNFLNGLPQSVIDFLLPKHREYCHLQSCNDWAATMDYSNALIGRINATAWTIGNTPADVFDEPWDETFTLPDFPNGDPFLNHPWDGTGDLTSSIDDYYSYLSNSPSGVPSLDPPVTTQFSSSGPAPVAFGANSSSISLFHYVNHVVNLIEDENENLSPAVLLTSDYYLYQKRLMFKGIYDQIKMELIAAYQNDPLLGNCPYYSDANSVFMGPMTQAEMEQEIAGALSGVVNSNNCAAQAYVNTVDWIGDIDQSCLDDLALVSDFNPSFTELDLMGNSGLTLEQSLYDYVLATCSTNPLGLFFNPDVNDINFDPLDPLSPANQTASEPGELEYITIHQLLISCSLTMVPPSFENIPAPQPSVTNITNQTFSDCFLEYMQLMNDGLAGLSVNPQPVTPCNSPNVVSCEGFEIDITASGDYPILTGVCGLAGVYKFYKRTLVDGTYLYEFGIDSGSCLFKLYYDNNLLLSIPAQTEFVSITNPVANNQGTLMSTDDIVSFDLNFADLSVGTAYLYTDEAPCLFGSDVSGVQTISFPTFPDLPDYTTPCIESTIGQATIDALNAYNAILNDLQNQFQESMASCIESASENFTMNYDLKEYQYTLYYYDLAGNLVQTVPPQGVHPIDISHFPLGVWDNTAVDHSMETRYKYNGLNTLIAQYTPDGGHSDFILDKLYRVRYSQNARQADESRASYTKYDELGRVKEAGEMFTGNVMNGSNPLTLNDLNGLVEDNTFPSPTRRMDYTITHYEDVYSADPSIQLLFANGQQNLRNTIGAIEHVQTGEIGFITTQNAQAEFRTVISYSYDPHKNVQEMVSTNYHLESIGQQHKTVRYDYDLISGNVNELIYQEDRSIQLNEAAGEEEMYSDEFRHKYHYDANNRLIRAFTSKDGGTTWDKEAKYFYYLHGALARTELGEDEVQGTDYAYNLQGWLKGVNASSLVTSRDLGHDAHTSGDNQFFGADAHGFMLSYFDNDYQSIEATTAFADISGVTQLNEHPVIGTETPSNLYNGNIHNMVTALRDYSELPMEVLSNNYQYDQLQRIRSMKVYDSPSDLASGNHFDDAQLHRDGAYQTSYSFDKNGNLATLKRNGNGVETSANSNQFVNHEMDDFAYLYDDVGGINTSDPNELNRLASVIDAISGDAYSVDVEQGQSGTVDNYQYDASGQLKSDAQEEIEEIVWSVTGKVKEIKFTQASNKKDLKFVYDPMDMRVMKIEYLNDERSSINYTYYACDAQGNVLSTYERTISALDTPNEGQVYEDVFYLQEHMVYGSSRLGVDSRNDLLSISSISQSSAGSSNAEIAENFIWSLPTQKNYSQSQRSVGRKYYELSNHLGNVLEVISDRKVGILSGDDYIYSADVVSYSDYYPYGMLLPGRSESEPNTNGDEYRYGFQGQEMDDEVEKGHGNSINYKYRMHDPRIGRFFACDPLARKYPELTEYQFSSNSPIYMVELEGLEGGFYEYFGCWMKHEAGIKQTTLEEIQGGYAKAIYTSTMSTYKFVTEDAWKADTWKAAGKGVLVLNQMSRGGQGYYNMSYFDSKFGTDFLETGVQINASGYNYIMGIPQWGAFDWSFNLTTVGIEVLAAKVPASMVLKSIRVPAVASGVINRTLNGKWTVRTRNFVTKEAADFQAKVAGKKHKHTGNGQVYEIEEFVYNDVDFDGYSDGVLYEAKSGYNSMVDESTGEFYTWASTRNKFLKEVRGQLVAAEGTKLKWVFDNEKTMNATKQLFEENGINSVDFQFIKLVE